MGGSEMVLTHHGNGEPGMEVLGACLVVGCEFSQGHYLPWGPRCQGCMASQLERRCAYGKCTV